MLDYFGEIAIFHNITFNYGKKDHAIVSGRACIVLNNHLDFPGVNDGYYRQEIKNTTNAPIVQQRQRRYVFA